LVGVASKLRPEFMEVLLGLEAIEILAGVPQQALPLLRERLRAVQPATPTRRLK
jgi:hypothetical protein